MLGGAGGRHLPTRRRSVGAGLTSTGSTLGQHGNDEKPQYINTRRRAAVTTSDYKSCALVQTRLKFGDIT